MVRAETNKIKWVYAISGLFVVLNLILIANDFYWFSLLPLALLIIYVYLFAFDKLLLAIVFFVPLSFNLIIKEINVGVEIPTEPVMFPIMLFFFIRLLYKNNYDIKIKKHPITLIIILYLLWIFITAITSKMPLVSFKFLLAKLWFTVCFYFLTVVLFKDFRNIQRYIWLYTISLIGVIGYTIYNHSQYNFNEITSHWVMTPFFNDHTAYAASLAFLVPVFIYFSFGKFYNTSIRVLSSIVTIILLTAIILSYTRAAWTSLTVALAVYLIAILKINYKIVILMIIAIAGFLYLYQNDFIYKISKNKQQSSADFMKHVQSISNIKNDASNLERINRWHSAIRIWEDYPVFGTGPGTYQFIYAPYQNSSEKTIISTNGGDKGNAHSEYLGPLAEEGLPGMLIFTLIVIFSLITAFQNYKYVKDKKIRNLNLAIILGLITYFVHGLLNNFLDTDKASALFWGFIAMLVAIQLYHRDRELGKTLLHGYNPGFLPQRNSKDSTKETQRHKK